MSFKRVPIDVLENTILTLMEEIVCIDSMSKLRHHVIVKLKAIDPEYTVSITKLRKTVVRMDTLIINVTTAESLAMTDRLGGEKEALYNLLHCPVCGEKLKPVKNQTLYGWVVVVEKKCTQCGYWTGKKIRRPVRYEICLK